ncbi:hypothetical protein [Paenibacillus rhizolycopersici]|uniref:hypothetical protein n=1 Tax=Paenibacillus rhizolycopersici TaxID=2780073 RepID=UPI003D26B11F
MLDDTRDFSSVPSSIELLFENEKLDIMKILCLLYSISVKSQRYATISEILFYFSLVNYNLIRIFEDENYTSSPNQYFRFQARFNPLLIKMENLKLIEIKANIFIKTEDIKLKVTSEGKSFYEESETEFLRKLQEKFNEVFIIVQFTNANEKKLKEGKL